MHAFSRRYAAELQARGVRFGNTRIGVHAGDVIVDGDDLSQWEEALSKPTQAVFFETPSNPMQSLVDIAAVSEMAHAAGAKVVLDTCSRRRCSSRASRSVSTW